MNAADVNGFWRLSFVPVNGPRECHIVRAPFGEGLAVEIRHNPGLLHLYFIRVFTLDVPEILKTMLVSYTVCLSQFMLENGFY